MSKKFFLLTFSFIATCLLLSVVFLFTSQRRDNAWTPYRAKDFDVEITALKRMDFGETFKMREQNRQQIKSDSEAESTKVRALEKFPKKVTLIEDQRVINRVRERVQPALDLYQRSEFKVYVYYSDDLSAFTIHGVGMYIPSKMAAEFSREKLLGIVAHELAHELYFTEGVLARRRGDYEALRNIELFCDVLAIKALAELNVEKEVWLEALEDLRISDPNLKGKGFDTHPSYDKRREMVEKS